MAESVEDGEQLRWLIGGTGRDWRLASIDDRQRAAGVIAGFAPLSAVDIRRRLDSAVQSGKADQLSISALVIGFVAADEAEREKLAAQYESQARTRTATVVDRVALVGRWHFPNGAPIAAFDVEIGFRGSELLVRSHFPAYSHTTDWSPLVRFDTRNGRPRLIEASRRNRNIVTLYELRRESLMRTEHQVRPLPGGIRVSDVVDVARLARRGPGWGHVAITGEAGK